MIKIASSLSTAALLALGLAAAPAHALSSRTFVSAAIGNDGNNCDRPTPCRTFQGAHDKTSPDGEITVLDPGGYGGLTITKSISIVNDIVGEASVLVSGGAAGITVNAGAASYVNLRGITIQGIGFGGGTGLRFNSGFSLTMTNCVIRNHTGSAVEFAPNADSNLAVANTLLADNGQFGLNVLPTGAGKVKVSLKAVEMYQNSMDGVFVQNFLSTGTINVTVEDSVAANNARNGFAAASAGHAATILTVIRSQSVNNQQGLQASGGPAVLRVGQTAITGNATSWAATGGATLESYGDNIIDGNGDGNPAPFPIAKK